MIQVARFRGLVGLTNWLADGSTNEYHRLCFDLTQLAVSRLCGYIATGTNRLFRLGELLSHVQVWAPTLNGVAALVRC